MALPKSGGKRLHTICLPEEKLFSVFFLPVSLQKELIAKFNIRSFSLLQNQIKANLIGKLMIILKLSVLCPWNIFLDTVAPSSSALGVNWHIIFSYANICFSHKEKRMYAVIQNNNKKRVFWRSSHYCSVEHLERGDHVGGCPLDIIMRIFFIFIIIAFTFLVLFIWLLERMQSLLTIYLMQ